MGVDGFFLSFSFIYRRGNKKVGLYSEKRKKNTRRRQRGWKLRIDTRHPKVQKDRGRTFSRLTIRS
jgi:hypothetical protein